MLRIMRSHTVKLNAARQAQRVKTVRILRVFVFFFGKRAWGPSRFVPFPLFQQLFAIATVYIHLYETASGLPELALPYQGEGV